MKKLILTLIFSLSVFGANALEVSEGFTYSKAFWKNTFGLSQDINYALNIGFNFDLAEHDDIAHHIYTFSLPVMFRSEGFGFVIRPFIVPDNSNKASAFGTKASFTFNINQDDINNSSSHVFASVAYARQNAFITRTDLSCQKDNFDQLVYEGGVLVDYFNAYFFEVSGNIFDYPSGLSDVVDVAGVLDQQNLGSLDTLNYVLNLPKGSIGAAIKWNSDINQSMNTISYKFIEFKDMDIKPQHSLAASSIIKVNEHLYFNLAYNHLFIRGQKDKDIFRGSISVKF